MKVKLTIPGVKEAAKEAIWDALESICSPDREHIFSAGAIERVVNAGEFRKTYGTLDTIYFLIGELYEEGRIERFNVGERYDTYKYRTITKKK